MGDVTIVKRVNCQWGNFTREVEDVRSLVLPMSDETAGLNVNPEPDHATALRLEVSEEFERLQEITGSEQTMTNDCTARMVGNEGGTGVDKCGISMGNGYMLLQQ